MKAVLISALLIVVASAFGRIYIRIQTTSVGYELGALKTQEAELLEEKAQLKMDLATLTTKASLLKIINSPSSSRGVAFKNEL